MKNYVQSETNITVTAEAAATSGDGVLIGALFGVAQGTAAIGEDLVLVTSGVFDLPKLAAQAWAVGAKVYWDDGNSRCTTVASGNVLIGCAVAVAADPSDEGRVRVSGAVR